MHTCSYSACLQPHSLPCSFLPHALTGHGWGGDLIHVPSRQRATANSLKMTRTPGTNAHQLGFRRRVILVGTRRDGRARLGEREASRTAQQRQDPGLYRWRPESENDGFVRTTSGCFCLESWTRPKFLTSNFQNLSGLPVEYMQSTC